MTIKKIIQKTILMMAPLSKKRKLFFNDFSFVLLIAFIFNIVYAPLYAPK
jgi:hypothetical protein